MAVAPKPTSAARRVLPQTHSARRPSIGRVCRISTRTRSDLATQGHTQLQPSQGRPPQCLFFSQNQESCPSPLECQAEHNASDAVTGANRIPSSDGSRVTSVDTDQPQQQLPYQARWKDRDVKYILLSIHICWDDVSLTFSLNC